MTLITNIQGYSIHDGPGIRTTVFLKGCSLACWWCSNPECISLKPEPGFLKTLCTKCGRCADVCPVDALSISENGYPRIDRALCTACGDCTRVCDYKALVMYGEDMSAAEVFDIVKKDDMFYQSSGGGVTVSGGECLLHPEFVHDLFQQCRNTGIHTCIETSGNAPESALLHVLPLTDLILFDLKLMDIEKHRRFTGQPNDLILKNARIAVTRGTEVLFRMPLVPYINDDTRNIEETAAFIRELGGGVPHIELMPYHRLGTGKYDSLAIKYRLPDVPQAGDDQVASAQAQFEALGITCTVSR